MNTNKKTPLERIRQIRNYLQELDAIKTKSPENLYKVKSYWIDKIQQIKNQQLKTEKCK